MLHVQLEQGLESFFSDSVVPHETQSRHLLVALSGGIDSIVLLHSLQHFAQLFSLQITAMHVHHGLSPMAEDWLHFCQRVCNDRNIPFYSEKVTIDLQSGIGVESEARSKRYHALEIKRKEIGALAIVTAHHLQDQAETYMLQLVRGSGTKGLSAMAAWDDFRKIFRPLLHVSKNKIVQYAQHFQLKWVEDESNVDTKYDRNFMRHIVMPSLRERYPQIDTTIARSASHMAEAQILMDSLATQNLASCDVKQEWMGQSINIATLRKFDDIHAKNILRHWFHLLDLRMPNTFQLHDYWKQLSTIKPNRYLHLPLQRQSGSERAYLHHYQQRLYCVLKPPALPNTPLVWNGVHQQIWGDWLVRFKIIKGRGIALAKLGISPAEITLFRRYQTPMQIKPGLCLQLHTREGGESLQPDVRRPKRELKVLFQMLAVPPWQRAYHPIISVFSTENVDQSALVGLSSIAISADWQPGRNAYGLEVTLEY